jgi:hypothetical protein
MDTQKNALFEQLRSNKITLEEYYRMTTEVDQYRKQQQEAEQIEAIAKDIERKIIAAGGIAQKRDYGQIANPFKLGHKNLTNQMVVRKNLPELVDFLMIDAGLVAPDNRMQEELAIRERLEREMAMRQETDRLRRENDRMLNRQSAHPDFAAKVEAYKRAQANSIPYFGGR